MSMFQCLRSFCITLLLTTFYHSGKYRKCYEPSFADILPNLGGDGNIRKYMSGWEVERLVSRTKEVGCVPHPTKDDANGETGRLAALVPFAKGSVCVSHKPCGNPWKCKKCLSGEMHPSVQYSFRENGKLRTMHVQPRFLKQVQEAVANGREVERLLVEAGKKYIGFLRTQE